MKTAPRLLALTALLVAAACSSTEERTVIVPGSGEDPGEPDPSETDPTDPTKPSKPGDTSGPIDIRADTNRDGEIKFDDPTDDDGEDVWDAKHGAVFLANIDDDQSACPTTGTDVTLAQCNDAADEEVNGADDALDLARMKTKPWATAPADTSGVITFTATDHVRIFRVKGSSFTVFKSGDKLAAEEVRDGVELAIEAKDIVRDTSAWDGYVDITYKVDASGKSASDKLRMRVSPLMTYHHLLPAEQTWASILNSNGNAAMRADLNAALAAAGMPPVMTISTSDPWNQDYFETGFMSMPAPGGKQHVIRVNIRSANVQQPSSTSNPLRPAGRAVFALRGKDVAAVQEYQINHPRSMDSLNSFGNLETVPPYTFNGQSYPMGRVLRGSIPSFYPDPAFVKMMESQKVQPAIYIDTSWLLVGHVDETTSFVKAATPRGWKLLVNDANLAKQMLENQVNAGLGSTPMFVGKYWSNGAPAQTSINGVLSDTDVMSASAEAAAEVDAQVAKIKQETGLTDAEIVRIPFLHMTTSGYSVAYQPGMVNGIYISDTHFVAPDPHGPMIGGVDIFKAAMQERLAPLGITVHFAEDWDTYHRNLGEVHCGTNATRAIPSAKWWESGR